MNGSKGQVEFIIILGVVVVAVVAVYFVLQGGIRPPLSPIEQEKAAIEASVENFVYSGAAETLRTLSLQGGYINENEYAQGFVRFGGDEIPYWQVGGSVSIPDIEANLQKGMESFITGNKDSLASSFSKRVTIGDPRVSINMLDDKVIITVNMPTTLYVDDKPYGIQQPYSVTIPTKLGEIKEFSASLANSQTQERYLEYFTLSTMSLSPFENGKKTVPVGPLVLTECGESYYKSWNDIKPGVELSIKKTLAQTYMPGKAPTGIIHLTSSPKYILPISNANRYSDLDVSFHLPDSFELNHNTLQVAPDPVSLVTKTIPFVGFCQSDSVYIKYFVVYPTVTRISDPLTGNDFRFASQVYILNNLPGDWGNVTSYDGGLQSRICSSLFCSISITAKDSQGNAVKGASVNFMGCSLGETDSNGVLNAPSPCGLGPLRIDSDMFEEYEEMKSTNNIDRVNELENIEVVLAKKKAVTLHFYEVTVDDFGGKYRIPYGGINPLEDKFVRMEFSKIGKEKTYPSVLTDLQAFTLYDLPEGNYVIGATLENTDFTTVFGAFGTAYGIGASDLYVYLPSYLPFKDITNTTDRILSTFTLTNVLKNCMGGPILTDEYKQEAMLTCEG